MDIILPIWNEVVMIWGHQHPLFLSLKRTKTGILHWDVAFEDVLGLQFVVERDTSPWKLLRARFITHKY